MLSISDWHFYNAVKVSFHCSIFYRISTHSIRNHSLPTLPSYTTEKDQSCSQRHSPHAHTHQGDWCLPSRGGHQWGTTCPSPPPAASRQLWGCQRLVAKHTSCMVATEVLALLRAAQWCQFRGGGRASAFSVLPYQPEHSLSGRGGAPVLWGGGTCPPVTPLHVAYVHTQHTG